MNRDYSSGEKITKCTDAELVRQFKNGANMAVGELLDRYNNFIFAKARLLTGDQLYFDDLVQEGKIGLFKAALNFSPDKNVPFSSFATICIFREMLKFSKKISSYNNNIDDAELSEIADMMSIEELVIGNEGADSLRLMIDKELGSFEKSVLDRYYQKKSYAEIASELGTDAKTVDNTLFRIKKKIAAWLQKGI